VDGARRGAGFVNSVPINQHDSAPHGPCKWKQPVTAQTRAAIWVGIARSQLRAEVVPVAKRRYQEGSVKQERHYYNITSFSTSTKQMPRRLNTSCSSRIKLGKVEQSPSCRQTELTTTCRQQSTVSEFPFPSAKGENV